MSANLHPAYRPDIDGLRAIAVLSVIGFHAGVPGFGGGFVGVDVFFVISGFLISSILFKSLQAGHFSFRDFYARRIRRIFPALIAVLIAVLAYGFFILLPSELKRLAEHVAASAGFSLNILLTTQTGYFEIASEARPLLHLWSLSVEEQYYLLWPALIYFAWKKKWSVVGVVGSLFILSFALNIWSTLQHPRAAFFLLPMRMWELGLGSLLACAQLPHENPRWSPALRWLKTSSYSRAMQNTMAAAGLLLIVIAVFAFDKDDSFPGWRAFIPDLGAFLLMLAGSSAWPNKKLLASPLVVFIGLISYPLYLWHWPLLSYLHIVLQDNVTTQNIAVAVALSFLLAALTYICIEKPVKKFKLSPLALLAILCGIGFSGFAIPYLRPDLPPQLAIVEAAIDDWGYPGPYLKPFKFQEQVFYAQGASARKTLFIGESNMRQYVSRISRLIVENPHLNTAVFATFGRCLPIPGVNNDTIPDCSRFNKSVRQYSRNDDIDTVVFAASWAGYFSPHSQFYFQNGEKYPLATSATGREKALASLENWIIDLRAQGKRVYLVLNIPNDARLDPHRLLRRGLLGGIKIATESAPRQDIEQVVKPVNDLLRTLAREQNVIVVDPLDSVCTAKICPAVTAEGIPLYKDSRHLSAAYVREYVRFLDETLRKK
jgi:peptidoglycan/LPS O-acetylase OafA/YrhL